MMSQNKNKCELLFVPHSACLTETPQKKASYLLGITQIEEEGAGGGGLAGLPLSIEADFVSHVNFISYFDNAIIIFYQDLIFPNSTKHVSILTTFLIPDKKAIT